MTIYTRRIAKTLLLPLCCFWLTAPTRPPAGDGILLYNLDPQTSPPPPRKEFSMKPCVRLRNYMYLSNSHLFRVLDVFYCGLD